MAVELMQTIWTLLTDMLLMSIASCKQTHYVTIHCMGMHADWLDTSGHLNAAVIGCCGAFVSMLHRSMCGTTQRPVPYLAVSLEALHVLMCLLHANARQGLQKVTPSKDAHLHRHAGDSH